MSLPRKLWDPSLIFFPAKPPPFEQPSHLPEASPADMSPVNVSLFNHPPESEDEEEYDQSWSEVENEKRNPAGLRSCPLFDRAAAEESPLSSPAISDTLSEDEDSDYPAPIHHPHPKFRSSLIVPPTPSVTDDYIMPTMNQDEVPPSSPESENALSSTSSLVPTIIISRSPSPKPHPCVGQAEELGIKVRDFAYETHGVPLAMPVPDLDQLQARYLLYRSAGLSPPPEVIAKLSDLDEEWLTEHARIFDNQLNSNKPKTGNAMFPWRRPETKRWRGFGDEEPLQVDQVTSVGSGAVGETHR